MSKKNLKSVVEESKTITEDIIVKDLALHAEGAYLEYAMSVVKGRAIPSVEDGLKPVQRRILFAMKELGLQNNAKPKKSARVVGDVIGKYHPHGDSAVYEAMVRTSQSFSLRYPLVVGEGNFGSRDGDSAAAMRYTEARLSVYADTFLSELGMGTVDWRLNYDGSMSEPQTLPARLPNILLNGAPGIGVGIATEIPPHNLVETVDACIALIKNPKMSLEEVLKIMPGPDYPTGGQIISTQEEIAKAYAEGKGSVRIRAKWSIEGEGTKNWKIVITELPYPTSTQQVMEEIERILNPKAKEKNGKKFFSPEQLKQKALLVNLIEKYTDGSDKDNPLRLVIEPKSYKQNPQELMSALLAYTSLEMNCSINLVAVGLDKVPKQKTLMDLLQEWTTYRVQTVFRRTEYEHQVASKRLHILEGRLTILDHIEEVVRILKTAEDPKVALMERFSLSEVQAEDVMEIRLRQLARLERQKIVDEIKKLEEEIKRLARLLENKTALKNQVIKELEADKKTFGDARRTLLKQDERSAVRQVEEATQTAEPITVAISERGWIRAKAGHTHTEEAFPFKAGDRVKALFKTMNTSFAIFLDEQGKSYSIGTKELGLGKSSDDVPISTLVDFGSKMSHAFVAQPEDKFVLATDAGYGFICKASDMITRIKAGKALISVDAGQKILPPLKLNLKFSPEQSAFATLSSNHRLLMYRLSEINELAKGKGVALLGLDTDCKLKQIAVLPNNELSVQVEGAKKLITLNAEQMAKHFQSRSSSKKGKLLELAKGKPFEIVVTENIDEQ